MEQSPVFKGKTVYTLPFGVDQTIFKPADTRQVRAELGIPVDDLVLFCRIDTSGFKGFETIQHTLRRLAKESVPATILTVKQKGLLQEFEKDFNILEFGWVEDENTLARLYQAADLFLMPSDMEAFGIMAVEAMSCGKMVLAVPGTALESVIGAPDCGKIAEKEEYPDALLALIRAPSQITERGQQSLAFAKKHYELKDHVDGMQRIYSDVMERFETTENAVEILASLSLLEEQPDQTVMYQYTLFKSRSWRITKPMCAFADMVRGMRNGPIKALKGFFSYEEERPTDEMVMASSSWRVTAPLRAIRGWFAQKAKETER